MARGVVKDQPLFVYCHITPNRKRYVGISCNPRKRWGTNGCNYRKNYRFYRAIKKYGWKNIQHIILFEGLKLEQAKEIEADLVKRWELTNFENGYNIREGGDGPFSLEARKKMSQSRIGKNYCKGRVLCEESRKKISESLKAYYSKKPKKVKPEKPKKEKKIAKVKERIRPWKRAIKQLTLDGELLTEYSSIHETTRLYGFDASTIVKCCRGKAKKAYGYRWEYAE